MKFQYTEILTPVLLMKLLLEPTTKRREDLGKHSVYNHFPKDRNCEICQRTKITRAPFRRRNGGALVRAENFHKGCDSRNNHRCAVGSARLGHPMDPVVSVQNNNFSGNTKEFATVFGSRIGSLKSFTLTLLWNLAKLVKIFLGIIARLHHTDQKQMGLLKEQCAE